MSDDRLAEWRKAHDEAIAAWERCEREGDSEEAEAAWAVLQTRWDKMLIDDADELIREVEILRAQLESQRAESRNLSELLSRYRGTT